jgi:hypothetical protein
MAQAVVASSLLASPTFAHSIGPDIFCETYPSAPTCMAGLPACTYCHDGAPPTRNVFGHAIEQMLLPGAPRPLSDTDYAAALPGALHGVEPLDSDGDGFSNLDEITAGTLPADPHSLPDVTMCPPFNRNGDWDVCFYDPKYVFKKVHLDFCGASATFGQYTAFLAATDKAAAIDQDLDGCLKSIFWRGKNGQLWQLAHRKIRPVQAIKAGEDSGQIPLSDYYDDYALFTWTQIDDHDAREVLTADYYVTRTELGGNQAPTYQIGMPPGAPIPQSVVQPRRAGMLTTSWNLVYNVMFTALPRTAAAQAYRSFLGKDIAKLEGLNPVPGEPKDYDARGVTQEACTVCHSTLDPLSYPFKNYNGLTSPYGQYDPTRIQDDFAGLAPNITMMPEAGYILGQPVQDLVQWAQVAANSDEFAAATVMDYWKLVLGRPPVASEEAEFNKLWADLKGKNNYGVERMLHDLVKTEAYGVP